MSTAALYAGVPLDHIATRTVTTETVTRYDTVTGKPHQTEVTTVTYETIRVTPLTPLLRYKTIPPSLSRLTTRPSPGSKRNPPIVGER